MTKQRKFYVPQEDEKLLDDLQEILKRENRSLSLWIREQARPYVELHRPGNPQQRLDTIMALGKAYRASCSCLHPRNKGGACEADLCPLVDQGLGKEGRLRFFFEDYAVCLFRNTVDHRR